MRLINADKLKEEINSWGMNDYEPSDFVDAIDEAPTIEPTFGLFKEMLCGTCQAYMKIVEPERPYGKWIKNETRPNEFQCDNCGNYDLGYFPFCHWCGADMRDKEMMTCKDCIHSGLCYKENDYENFPDRCGDFISDKVLDEVKNEANTREEADNDRRIE